MAVIAHVIVGLGRGGAELMLRRLIEANLHIGAVHEHCVISLTNLGVNGEQLREEGVTVYALGLRSPIGLPATCLRLAVLLRKIRPVVVQTWMVHSDLVGGIAARLAGVRYVVWGVRTTDYSVESRSTRAVRWLCARLSSYVPTRIVAAAEASMESSLQAGYRAEKFMVIPNGFDVAALRRSLGRGTAIRERVGIRADELVIGCLGRYNPAKDHVNFVRAAGSLAPRHPGCRFLMVGADVTPRNRELMSAIRETGCAERFTLSGEQSDAAAFLDAMDIFVLPSCTEGFPNVLGEAMAMGLPCVSTDVGDAAVLLGDAGELVPPRDSTALAVAIERFLAMSREQRLELGRKGLERVERHFSIATTSRRFSELYSSLANGR